VKEVDRELAGRPPEHDFTPTLDRMRRAVAFLGDPQGAYQVIHIAGTNGKTSTARMAEALLRAHGLRTGLLTSPPFTSPLDRIAVDGDAIGPEAFLEAWEQVAPILTLVDAESAATGGPPVSVFEAYTLAGLVAFADAPVDVAVIEVGMGGTWDATNVVDSQVQVVTPISRDHEEWLGSDLAGIAEEKAGILQGRAVIGHQDPRVGEVLDEVARTRGTETWWAGRDFGVAARTPGVGGQMVDLQGLGGLYPEVWVPLLGAHQADNAALALAAVEAEMGGDDRPMLDLDVVREGFASATSPGRLQVVRASPLVVVDSAHNPAGAQVLADAVEEIFPGPLIGLVGVLAGKDAEGILGALEPVLDSVVVTQPLSPRAVEVEALVAVAEEVFGEDRVVGVDRLDEALAHAIDLAESDADASPGPLAPGVLATGSVTMAAQVATLLGWVGRSGGV
jgi:dihydrofolate synthase/folylpolyglutamate synthase